MKKISKICLIIAMIPSSIMLAVGSILVVLTLLGWGDLGTLVFSIILWMPMLLLLIHAIIIIKKGLKDAWYLNVIYLALSISMFILSVFIILFLIQNYLSFFMPL